jgi:IS1 family transposase
VFRCEADELWSFVGEKANKQWVWMVMNTYNRQIIALHIGGRGIDDAWKLWNNVPSAFQQQACFFTDFWKAYNILEDDQHVAAGKEKGFVNHLERFNCTLRQRCSRLVRKALSFSKKQSNHVGAIKYFICHYNQHLALHL